jgi:proteasome lid subunit RPN8/RPN11
MPEEIQPRIIQIKRQDYERMCVDVSSKSPEEACGLLAGQLMGELYQTICVFPTTNLLHSTTRYRIDPAEQLAAFNQMDLQGLEMVGIYHSHPNGPDSPSPTDIAEAYYPEAVHLIWFRQNGEWGCNAYTIRETDVDSVRIELLDGND